MAVTNTFTSGTLIKSSEVNTNFTDVVEQAGPIGTVASWLKSYTNTPALSDSWVECNGQTLSDADSVYNGQVIPDLNSGNLFLRGATTSGATGGLETAADHTHDVTITSAAVGAAVSYAALAGTYTSTSEGGHDNRPPFMNVVWIMRIK